jgi:hypothetical protein
MAVKGLKGRWNGTVNTLEVNCQSYAEPRTIEYSAPAGFGSIPFPARRASELAAGRSVVTHLVVEGNSSGVQRVAGVQALIVNNQVPGGPPLALNSFGLIKGHGQLFGSSAPLDPCPTGAAVVGLHVLTAWGNPGELHALGAVCAPVNDWVNGNQSTTTRLPARGIMNGQPGESLCPARSFLVGWHVVNTGAKITSMTPYCRQVR